MCLCGLLGPYLQKYLLILHYTSVFGRHIKGILKPLLGNSTPGPPRVGHVELGSRDRGADRLQARDLEEPEASEDADGARERERERERHSYIRTYV